MACADCNNGWMSRLELAMAEHIAPWLHETCPLTPEAALVLASWALKTHLVLSCIEGNVRRFGDDAEEYVVPDATRARQLFEADESWLTTTTVGAARSFGTNRFGYVFGNPVVLPVGQRYANRRSASASIVTVGGLQLWLVAPILGGSVRLPRGIRLVRDGLLAAALPYRPLVGDLDDIVVDNGEHNIKDVMDYSLAEAQRLEAEKANGS